MSNDDIAFICHECIGDSYLKAEIRSLKNMHRCVSCGTEGFCISLPDLAERVHSVFLAQYFQTPEEPDEYDQQRILNASSCDELYWEREGDSVSELLQQVLGIAPELADTIQGSMSDRYDASHREIVRGNFDEQPYADSALYVETFPGAGTFRDTWKAFKDEIGNNARFFNSRAEELLASIFSDLDTLITHQRKPIIRLLSPEDEYPIWRARVAYGEDDVHEFLQQPVVELGPPPPRLVRAGRMNPAGIPVFYGAEDIETCIAEIRAPVGSQVVMARYELLRSVRVLDFDRLRSVYNPGSHFDPGYARRHSLSAFLREFVEEVGRPVLPQDEDIDYLSTQAVAEYLAHRIEPRLDGIIFHSAQSGRTKRNIVFFNHASTVEALKCVRLAVGRPCTNPDEEADALELEGVARSDEQEPDVRMVDSSRFPLSHPQSEETLRTPTLRLKIKSLCVFEVSHVSYRTTKRTIYNYAPEQ